MNTVLPMHAWLYPEPADASSLDAREIARRVAQACPQAVIDWDRGNAWVEERLQQFIAQRIPEVIYEGHRRLFGQTVYISLSYPDWPNRRAYAYVCGNQIEQGDALFLQVTDPFELDLLKRGAQDLAAALGFQFRLECQRDGVLRTVTSPCRMDPLEFVRRWEMPTHDYPTIRFQELTDWKATMRNSVMRWLSACESQDKIQAITAGFASHAAFAEAVLNELEAIAPVERGWGIDVAGQPHQNAILLDHGNWLTIVRLFGVLKQIVIEQ